MILVAIVPVGISGRRAPEFWERSREAATEEADDRDCETIDLARDDAKLAAGMRHLADWAAERKVRFGRAATHFWEPDPGEIPILPLPLNRGL